MIKNATVFFFFMILSTAFCTAQKSTGIKSTTEFTVETKAGKENEIKKSFQQFDAKGNVIEEIEFDEFENEKSHVKNEYNSSNQKIKELKLLPNGKADEVTLYEYDEKGNRISKTVTDKDGKVKSKKRFVYEYY
ncbi:MAG: hypothetical protein LH473_05970 [Chitinophagales bacterium]|nr:hypothetical protein [Chitinophagales bacterium]